jgi:hypothetical protein
MQFENRSQQKYAILKQKTAHGSGGICRTSDSNPPPPTSKSTDIFVGAFCCVGGGVYDEANLFVRGRKPDALLRVPACGKRQNPLAITAH